MLRTRGGGSHVIQAKRATLRSNVGWPLRYAIGALAASLQSRCGPEVLPTSSAQVRTRTGRIRSVLPSLTAPFCFRLSISSIRLTRPAGAEYVTVFTGQAGRCMEQ